MKSWALLILAVFCALPAMADLDPAFNPSALESSAPPPITGPMATDHRFQCYEGLGPKIDPTVVERSTESDPLLKHIDIHNAYQMMALSMLAYYPADQIEGSAPALGFNVTHVFSTQKDTLPAIENAIVEALNDLAHLKIADALKIFNTPLKRQDVVFANSQAVWFENDDYVVIAFRGTAALKANIFSDLYSLPEPTDLGIVHAGFYSSFQIIWPEISKLIADMKTPKPIYFTGHSLGGALAVLGADEVFRQEAVTAKAGIPLYDKPWVKGLYTFAAPQIGNQSFVNDVQDEIKTLGFQDPDFSIARVQTPYDVVPLVPYFPSLYSQLTDSTVYFSPDGKTYIGPQAMSELPSLLTLVEQRKHLGANHQFEAYFKGIGMSLGIDGSKFDACSKM